MFITFYCFYFEFFGHGFYEWKNWEKHFFDPKNFRWKKIRTLLRLSFCFKVSAYLKFLYDFVTSFGIAPSRYTTLIIFFPSLLLFLLLFLAVMYVSTLSLFFTFANCQLPFPICMHTSHVKIFDVLRSFPWKYWKRRNKFPFYSVEDKKVALTSAFGVMRV